MCLKHMYMSVAMLTTAGAILDAIGVPDGLGSKRIFNMDSGGVSFDDALRSKYLDQIGGMFGYEQIQLRKFTIFTQGQL